MKKMRNKLREKVMGIYGTPLVSTTMVARLCGH